MNIKFLQALLTAAILSMGQQALSQQQVMFTQYMFNGLAINPAYAGSHEAVSMTALGRQQWVGMEGAPSTQTFSVHAPIKEKKIALGFLFLHDKIGITEQNGLYASYAYRIQFPKGGKLALGLQAGATNYAASFSKVSQSDPTFMGGDVNEFHPNVGFGAYYSTKRFYAGLSLPQMLNTAFDSDNPDSDSKMIRHYFITAGYVLDLNEHLKLKPNLLVKAVEGAPVEFDVNLSLLINEIFWVGGSWRSFDSFDAIFQFNLNNRFQVGYAYDFATTTELSRVNAGSHEIMLNYRIPTKRNKIITPRYF